MAIDDDYMPTKLERKIHTMLNQRYSGGRDGTEFGLSKYGFTISRLTGAPDVYYVTLPAEPLSERSTTTIKASYNLPDGRHAPDAALEAMIGVQADMTRYAKRMAQLHRLGYRGRFEIRDENPVLRTTYDVATPTRRDVYATLDRMLPKSHGA